MLVRQSHPEADSVHSAMKTRLIPRERTEGADLGWSVMTTLIGGFAVWGGIGWLLDRWLETRFLTPVGLIVGMALGIYAVVARYGLAAAPKMQPAKPQLAKPQPVRQQTPDHRDTPPPIGAREETECH